MILEEAIRHYEESEKINKELAENCVSAMAKNHNLENAEKCRQMIEWLRELQERRKQPEIIRCGECTHSNKEYSGEMWCGICNGFGIDENSFCSFAEKRYVENG